MKIGIVGAGKIGGTLVRKLRASGHGVRVANSRGPESLSGLAAETGATAVTAAEVAAGVDVLIVSVRFQQLTALKPFISEVASDITVVDTSNYLPVYPASHTRDSIEAHLAVVFAAVTPAARRHLPLAVCRQDRREARRDVSCRGVQLCGRW